MHFICVSNLEACWTERSLYTDLRFRVAIETNNLKINKVNRKRNL